MYFIDEKFASIHYLVYLYIIIIKTSKILNLILNTMKRISLTSEESKGLWFDVEKAEKYNEKDYWDGRNYISRATGSQWDHEMIFITKSGKFILNTYSQWQDKVQTFEIISKDHAAIWFASQGFADDEIPPLFLEEVYKLEVV